ncbi:MAG: carbohydrate-binding family 9-like protein [Victivallales bacterium]|nr:carbohydrate-binding family 9-like protein [Victivallales bacterium]
MKNLLILLLISLLPATVCLAEPDHKKLIEFGWDVPLVDFVSKNIRKMEEMPFDGIVFRLKAGNMAFDYRKPAPDAYKEDFKHCTDIKWQKFTDNFVILFVASQQDWFDDEQWANISERAQLIAHAAKLARCKGVCIDPEPYGFNPWSYMNAERASDSSFERYEAVVRKRGAEFMTALEKELPGLTVLTLFQMTCFKLPSAPMSPEKRTDMLSNHKYALLPAFLEGMLEASSPETRIIDCNEPSYYHETPDAYLKDYHAIRQRSPLMLSSKYAALYASHVRAGMATYVDHCLALRPDKTTANVMTPQQRLKWLGHNIYYALSSTDSYALCFSERIDWWNGKVPEGAVEAIALAREKAIAGNRLGFSIRKSLEDAKKCQEKDRIKSSPTVSLEIQTASEKPVIDGKIDDATWKSASRLQPFQLLKRNLKPAATATTAAWLAFDEDNLFFALDCQEPLMDKLVMFATRHDDENIWEGDCAEFFLALRPGSPVPCIHFIFDPAGHVWDARHLPATDAEENPECTIVASQTANGWTIEMALPWDSLDMAAPENGTILRGNVTRQRCTESEQTSWSPLNSGFLEFANFGAFIFKK